MGDEGEVVRHAQHAGLGTYNIRQGIIMTVQQCNAMWDRAIFFLVYGQRLIRIHHIYESKSLSGTGP